MSACTRRALLADQAIYQVRTLDSVDGVAAAACRPVRALHYRLSKLLGSGLLARNSAGTFGVNVGIVTFVTAPELHLFSRRISHHQLWVNQ